MGMESKKALEILNHVDVDGDGINSIIVKDSPSPGIENDFFFQTLTFLEEAVQTLTLATIVLRDVKVVLDDDKEELKKIQHGLHDYTSRIRADYSTV